MISCPWAGPARRILRINTSSVPCSSSTRGSPLLVDILGESRQAHLECQGESYSEQLAAIILTEATFSFAGEAASPGAGFASTVPVISTLCPTCDVNWLSSASRRYVFGVAVASDAGEAFVRMNFEASAAAGAPGAPVVPTGDWIPR